MAVRAALGPGRDIVNVERPPHVEVEIPARLDDGEAAAIVGVLGEIDEPAGRDPADHGLFTA
ncbi:hypothetical protein GCM10023192_72850 [Amycolatopsis samaneae]